MEKKEAMKILKDFHDKSALFSIRTALDTVIPELKESKDDRIRRNIIAALKGEGYYDCDLTNECIAWVEKQDKPNPYSGVSFEYNGHTWGMCARDNGVEILVDGELKAFVSSEKSFVYPIIPQPNLTSKSALEAINEEKIDNQNRVEPVNNIESKFKVGDWITNGDYTWKIVEVKPLDYILQSQDNNIVDDTISYVDKHFHSFTIEDAKDGDVLVLEDEISLYKHDIKNCTKEETTFGGFVYHCCYDGKRFITDSLYSLTEQDKTDIHPATKEQHELLFSKMKEAGYEWDAKKKELKKIEEKSIDNVEPKFRVGDIITPKDGRHEPWQIMQADVLDKKYRFKEGYVIHFSQEEDYELVEQNPIMIQWQGNNLKEVIDFTGKDKNFDKWFKSFEEYEKYVRDHDNIFKLFNEDGSHFEIPVGAWIVKTPDGYNVASKAIFKNKTVEWSEEMGKLCLDAIYLLRDYASGIDKNSQLGKKIGRVDAFLSDLYHDAFYPSTYNMREDLRKAKWSEEDEDMLDNIIDDYDDVDEHNLVDDIGKVMWLKSLKQRIGG